MKPFQKKRNPRPQIEISLTQNHQKHHFNHNQECAGVYVTTQT